MTGVQTCALPISPDDPQHPTSGITLPVAVEIAKRPEHRLLHDIGGIGIVAREPSRERVGGIEMGQRYRLKPVAMRSIRVPRLVPSRDFLRFGDIVGPGRGPVETKGTPKAAEPSFRAGLSVGWDIVRQSEILSICVLDVEGMSLNEIKVLVGAGDLS